MISILAFGFGFVLGMLTGQGKLNWVRGAAGKARDAVFGLRPAASRGEFLDTQKTAATVENKGSEGDSLAAEVSPTPPKNPIKPLKVLSEVGKFIWHWRHWIVAGLIALVVWGFAARVVSFVTCPFGGILWCATDNDDAALENERTNTAVAQHETTVSNRGAELADETHRDARRREEVVAQAEQEIADAVSQADFDLLHSAYERATAGVWSGLELEGEPDHSSRGSDPVRRSGADSA